MHRPAVCGVGEIRISDDRRSAELEGVTLREGDVVSVDGDRGLLIHGEQELDEPANDPAVRTFLSWCAERARVTTLDAANVAELPVVDTLAALEAGDARLMLDLQDPSSIPPPDLARAIADRGGPAPVLRISSAWLRAADVRLRGRVSGIVATESSPSIALIKATLGPA
jgi:hypothetical protein